MLLKDNEVIDDLQRDGLKIIQKKDAFKFGIDAVLLSDFSKAKKGDVVFDFGTGTGIIPILLSAKTQAGKIIGIEIQSEMSELAARSVTYNSLDDLIQIHNMDINNVVAKFGKASADVIVCNPPYFPSNGAIRNPNESKSISRHEIKVNIDEICEAAGQLLKPNGNIYLIHRPYRMSDVIYALKKNNLEPKELRLISPNINKAPNLFLIRANKGGRPELKFLDPLYVYDLEGNYTKEIFEIYNASQIDVFDKRGE